MSDFHKELQCFPLSLTYDFGMRVGMLIVADGGCTDMDGCIAFFERIDPSVRQIQTASDGQLDTVYTRTAGRWRAN
ncbi:hypothetical protein [Pelagibacterium luteolum]|uniref:hypothetical protein n=1 Tax=Pelagibacterium luteolum TaxID=440168 RepID=UPI00115FAFE4|nr:hypothetical protein [Pelagibacterium luteolum]